MSVGMYGILKGLNELRIVTGFWFFQYYDICELKVHEKSVKPFLCEKNVIGLRFISKKCQ